jgi:hypothetical protein
VSTAILIDEETGQQKDNCIETEVVHPLANFPTPNLFLLAAQPTFTANKFAQTAPVTEFLQKIAKYSRE